MEHYTRSQYVKIKVWPGVCRYNYQCHVNAVHDAKMAKEPRLAMVIYIDDGWPIVHFINITNGTYVDNTLGAWCEQHEYYLVRDVMDAEYWDIGKIHESAKKVFARMLPWYIRLFSDYRG